MKKHLRLMLALLTLTLGWTNASAQTDVTSQYITNPSFESDGLMSAGNGTSPTMIQPTGWTQEQNAAGSYQDNKICNAETSNGSNYGTLVTPSDGTYYLFYRHGWNGSNYAKFTSKAVNLPAGAYTLKVDYKMVSGSDNTNNNDNTAITLSAISGETTLGTNTAKGAVQVNNNGTTAVLKDNDWITLETTFTLETETSTQFVINLLACGPKRSDFVVDNVRILYTAFVDPTAITLSESSLSMIPTATKTLSVTYTPTNVDHNTAITWRSSDENVATVSDAGVVTAVAAGTATITATTANNVTAACTVTVNEAPLANGDYYILNVSKNKYLGGANSWGSQASVIDHGIPFYAELADGAYKLDSRTYNSDTDHFVGLNDNGDLYMDNAGTGLYITSLGNGKYSISTADGSGFLTTNSETTIVGNGANDASSELAQWKFVTKSELETALANATSASPVDATFYIADQNFSRNYWPAGRNKSSWTMVASNQNLKGGNNDNMCAESYHSTFTLSQVLTVPNGQYKLRAQACENVSSPVAVVYANDETTAFKAMANGEGSMGACSTQFSAGNYYTDWITVNVTDNTLTVGAKSTSSSNWCVWDNFELYYYGIDLSAFAASLASAVAAAQALEGTIPAAAYTILNGVVTENNKTYTTVDDYAAAINAIIEATNTAKALQTPYSNYVRVKAKMQTIKNASGFTDPNNAAATVFDNVIANQDDAVEQAVSVDAIQACIDAVRTAAGTFLGAVEITGTVDATALIMNDTPTSNADFWTTTGNPGFDAANNVAEYWNQSGASIKQTLYGLPAGYYTLTAVALARPNQTGILSANENTVNLVQHFEQPSGNTTEGGNWFNAGNGVNELPFRLDDAGNVEVGITADNANGDHWTVWRSFKLEYLAPIIPVESISLNPTVINLSIGEDATLTSTLSPANANTDTDITWSTDDATIATVADGVVTAIGIGTATITATTANNCTATCQVTVNDVTPVDAPAYYSEVAAGDFYIVNAATGKYLGGANSWGTQASLIEHGIPFTVALNDEKYTLDSHTYNNANDHFLNGTYVDKPSTDLYIVSLGNGKYSISTSDGSEYLSANANNTVVANTAANANSVLAQWYFVSKEDRDKLLDAVTDANPADATYNLVEANISRNLRKAYNTKGWTGDYSYGGANENQCAERYKANTNVYQTITVPNGKYTVSCQGFYRQESGDAVSYLYANDFEVALNKIEAGGINSMDGASEAFSNGEYTNTLTVFVTNGELKVGIKCDAATNWTIWDNFEISYHGPTIGGKAEELPALDMTAGNWYYFDIAVDGNYNLSTTTLNDIVYTTDGTILIENESSVTGTFGANPVTLTAGRYYVKSASAQTLAVAAASYNYELGDATLSVADGGYTQASTYTVTFPNAATNDPDGTAALVASSTATVNGESVNLTAVENGFSLNLGTLTPATDFMISIPADVYGYAVSDTYNEAISLTIHTPAVFDGEYCLYDATNKLFLGRGNAWGTQASVDKYGIPFNLVTDATNTSSIEFVDWTGVYLFLTNGTEIFTDNASTGWKMVTANDGYYLKTANDSHYATHEGTYIFATTEEGSATVWTLKTKAERDAIIASYPTENITNVITASGISTTSSEFESYLRSNYVAEDCTSSIGTAKFSSDAGDWTWNQVRGQDKQPAYGENFAELWNATGSYTQTISGLEAGIYKLTVQGFERRKDNNGATALYNAGYNLVSTYMAANDEQVRFTDWNLITDKPNNTGGAVTAFNNNEAVNEVYVYLDGTHDLTITVKKPNYIWDCWVIFNNFTLTRYAEKPEIVTVTVNKNASDADGYCYGTLYYSDKALVVPEGLTAYTYKVTDGTLSESMTYETGDVIPAGTGVVVKTASNTLTENASFDFIVTAKNGETDNNNMLHGTDEAATTDAGEGSWKYYALSLNSSNTAGTVGFYFRKGCPNGEAFQNGAHKAYLAVPVAQAKGMSGFAFGSETDGIGQMENAELTMENATIYNLAGQKVNNTQKGVYIVNGKKVVIK